MVYITGDLHGDFSRFSSPDMRRMKKGDTLIICGDFGFLWNGDKKEKKQQKKLGKLRYTVLFVDGRNENYDLLNTYPVTEWNGGRVQIIEGSLMHLMRGEIYTIEGERYFTFGGGETPDVDIRRDGKTWWEKEMPSVDEMLSGLRRLEENGNEVDYIVTHEPSGKASGYLSSRNRLNGINIFFNKMEDTVAFKRWFFGCLHMDKPMSKKHLAVFRAVVPVHKDHMKK